MVEHQIHRIEEDQTLHIETIEIPKACLERFFLNEELSVIVICNAADSAGQAQIEGDLSQIIDIGICNEDPSTGDLVKRPTVIDLMNPIQIMGGDVLRVRYLFEGKTEEVRFMHKQSDPVLHPKRQVTTQRMRNAMHASLGLY